MLRKLSATLLSRPPLGTVPLALLVGLQFLFAAGRASCEEPAAAPITSFGDEVDPDSDCDVIETAGVATITVPPTWHDLTHTEEYDRLNAPRLLHDVEGDFTLQVKIAAFELPPESDSSGGRYAYLGAGVLLWQDEDNYVRFERAALSPRRYASIERFTGGKRVGEKSQDLPAAATWFRVSRRGDRFRFEWSRDGRKWLPLHAFELQLAKRLQVGVHAINTTNQKFAATFSDYKLTP